MPDLIRFLSFRSCFLRFNGRGEKDHEFVVVIDRTHVLYWLDRQEA
jgi:hypothetical protein